MTEPNYLEIPRLFIIPVYTLLEPELLSADGSISLLRNTTIMTSGTTAMTLADSIFDGFIKRIQTQGSSVNTTITCNLNQSEDLYVSVSISGNGKLEMIWDSEGGFYRIFDQKNITKNL
jgi:hypothetical protein